MFYYTIWFFFLYAFLGWCTEVAYAAAVSRRFVNRGFLNGPWCPVYGFGAVAVLSCLEPLKGNLLLLFLGSVVLTSALEWLTGFVLEKIFHQRWWDYSDQPLNLNGYICLKFSLAWGAACLFVVQILHPGIRLLVRVIPHSLGVGLLVLLAAAIAVDLAATVSSITKLNRRLALIDELAGKIKSLSNDFGEDLADKVLDAAERGADFKEDWDEWTERLAQKRAEAAEDLDDFKDSLQDRLEEARAQSRQQLQEWRDSFQELLDKNAFGQRRLLKAFPKLRSTRHRTAMDRLRRRLDRK